MGKINQPIIFLLLLTALMLACVKSTANNNYQSDYKDTGEETIWLAFGGRQRSYILYAPASIKWDKPTPLIFILHGGTGNAESAIRMSNFNEVADKNGILVVYPNGTGRLSNDKLLTWNGGDCCAYAETQNVDDVGFIRAIVSDLRSKINIDTKRIYAAGLSNGGIMSQRLACEAADIFAGIAPVAGTLNYSPCAPSQPISVIEFHGTDDQHIPYQGGRGSKSLVDVDFASVEFSINFWVSYNQCSSQPQTSRQNDIQLDIWSNCRGSTSVELYTILGGGHAWPGGQGGWADSDRPTNAISASEIIWEFFMAHPKQ
jgi:polyhydroxybutyrate depolymerase